MLAALRHPATLDRTIARSTEVDCPFSTAIEYAAEHLASLRVLRVPLLGPSSVVVEKGILAVTRRSPDDTDPGRAHEALAIWLTPRGRFPFPRMRVLLTVRPYNLGTLLQLEAHYHAPLGRLGACLDLLWGKFVAAWTLGTLRDELRTALERASLLERQSLPSAI
jgi:hypothetical protein